MIKASKALRGFARLVWDPFDFGGAMALFDAFADWGPVRVAYQRMLDALTPAEREHLRELTLRPVDLAALRALPPGTLGHQYSFFFERGALDVDSQVKAHPDLADTFTRDWMYLRFCRVHDFHHVLLDFDVDPQGEMGLQAFNLRNFGEPFAALAMLSTPVTALRYGDARRMLAQVARGWRLGAALPNLFTVPFEDWYADDLADVRRRLGVAAG